MKKDVDENQSTGALIDEVSQMIYSYPQLASLVRQTTDTRGLRISRGRFPYDKSMVNATNTLHVFFSYSLPHVLVEVSGQACSDLGAAACLSLIAATEHSTTRIDVAVDVECMSSPKEVLDGTPEGRWRARGHIDTETGETVYLGSQKSDRYARVYRYNPPHPRSHYMRYEMVFKADRAKEIAKSLALVGIEETAAAAGNAFGWVHGTWQLRSKDTIKVHRPERNRAKTERWFYKTVAPSIRRMLSDGTLTERELLDALRLKLE